MPVKFWDAVFLMASMDATDLLSAALPAAFTSRSGRCRPEPERRRNSSVAATLTHTHTHEYMKPAFAAEFLDLCKDPISKDLVLLTENLFAVQACCPPSSRCIVTSLEAELLEIAVPP